MSSRFEDTAEPHAECAFINVHAVDPDGRSVPDVAVLVTLNASGIARSAVTDESGSTGPIRFPLGGERFVAVTMAPDPGDRGRNALVKPRVHATAAVRLTAPGAFPVRVVAPLQMDKTMHLIVRVPSPRTRG